jgi:outer membrane protein assembly factor BamB
MKSYLLSIVIALYCCSAHCGEVLKEIWAIKVDAITGNKGIYPERVFPFTGEDGSVALEFNSRNSLNDYIVWISSSGEVLKTISKLEIFGTGLSGDNPADVEILGCSNQLLTIIESPDIVKDTKVIQCTKGTGGLVTSQVETIPLSKTRGIFGTDGGLNKNIIITLKSQFEGSQSDTIVCYQLIKQHNGAGAGIGGGSLSQYVSFKNNIYDQFGILGGSVEFKVDVASSIPVTYQWQKDGKDLAGAALTNLRIDKIATINKGAYTLIVKSALGSVTSSPAKLDVVSLPVVTFATNRVTGVYGQLTTIAPTIISQGPTFYRWFKDSILLAGEERQSINIDATSKSGNYSVECRNLAGVVLSKTVIFVQNIIPPGAKKWEFLTGAGVAPAIGSDGTVYVGSEDKKVYALNGATGAKKWEFPTEKYVFSSPAIGSDGTVYVGSGDNKVYALNGATGVKKWEFLTGERVNSSPAIGSDGTVYIGSSDGKVYALNGATGVKKWEFLTGGVVISSPAIGSDGTVYVGSDDNNVYALNGATGAKKWEFLTGMDVSSSPAIGSDGTVYVGSYDKNVYALNGATGAKKWEFLTGGRVYSSPAIGSDGTVYVGSYDGRVYALNGATGAKKWEFLTGMDVSSSPAIGSDGTVYVGSYDKKVYALNGATGAKKWEFLTGGPVYSSPAIGSDGTVYVGSYDGRVYAIASSSEGLAKSPWPKFHANNQNTGKIASGFGPLGINYSLQSGLNLDIPVSPDFDTILEYSTNLNQWSEQQRFGRQSNTPSIVVPLKIDQTKAMEYWRTRSQ